MSFKYNDKLVIRDRKQMEDLFKYRLNLFDSDRTKKITIKNSTDNVLFANGKFNRTKNSLDIDVCKADDVEIIPESDVSLIIRPGNIGEIELIIKINDDLAL